MTAAPTKTEVLEQLFKDICHLSHKHQVQYWLDAPGTDDEKLRDILKMSRDGLALVQGRVEPEDV